MLDVADTEHTEDNFLACLLFTNQFPRSQHCPRLRCCRREGGEETLPSRHRGGGAPQPRCQPRAVRVLAPSVNMVLIYRRCVEKIRNISILVNSVWIPTRSLHACMTRGCSQLTSAFFGVSDTPWCLCQPIISFLPAPWSICRKSCPVEPSETH